MSNHPPEVVAMGEDMHRQMLERALADVASYIADDLAADEDALIHVEIGVAAGINAALRVLVERGLLRTAP